MWEGAAALAPPCATQLRAPINVDCAERGGPAETAPTKQPSVPTNQRAGVNEATEFKATLRLRPIPVAKAAGWARQLQMCALQMCAWHLRPMGSARPVSAEHVGWPRVVWFVFADKCRLLIQ